ncbi:unnamed protein product [Parajaminaea phylloscopi]
MSDGSPQKEVVRPLQDDKEKAGSHDAEKQIAASSRAEDGSIKLSSKVQEELARVDAGGLDAGYERKVFLLNKVMQDHVGMGKFQWGLFGTAALGWLIDNLWLQGVAIVLPSVGKEFSDAQHTPWMTFALYMGLICGAATWGILADIVGRKLSFNITLALGGIFGIAAGAAPSFTGLGGLLAALGFGVGGSLPVDGMLFLEFVPGSHQYLLTLLSVAWALGQLVASLIAWAFIAHYTCTGSNSAPTAGPGGALEFCNPADNMGWRYTFYTLGAISFVSFLLRFVVFQLPESPKFFLTQGRDAEAVAVMRDIARRNGRELPTDVLSVAILRAAAGEDTSNIDNDDEVHLETGFKAIVKDCVQVPKAIVSAIVNINADSFKPNLAHIRPLFATGMLTYNTLILWLIWGLIGLAYPLYNAFLPTYLATRFAGSVGGDSVNQTYRDYAIISACGVPGSIIAAWLVELPRSGRRGALAISTLLTGIFIYVLSTAKTNQAYLALNCVAALTQNMMYGTLYGVTPESFPAPARGFGDGIASSFNRITGSMAPIITIFAGQKNASAPLFTAGALFIVSAILAVTLRVETAGKAAL